MIAIVDYGAGNLNSVKKAFDYLGAEVVVTNQIGTQLVQAVIPLVAGLLMQSRNHNPRLPTVATAFDFATERLLCAPEFARLGTIPARVVDRFATRQHRDRLQANINADVRNDRAVTLRRALLFNHEADVPISTGFPLERRALGREVHRHRLSDANGTDFGDIDLAFGGLDPLRDSEPRRVPFPALEPREPGAAFEEVTEGPIQLFQGLLQRPGVGSLEPRRLGLILDRGQLGRLGLVDDMT